jgi:hypothetical protein
VKPEASHDGRRHHTDHREAQGWQRGEHAGQEPTETQIGADLWKYRSNRYRRWAEIERESRDCDQHKDPSRPAG